MGFSPPTAAMPGSITGGAIVPTVARSVLRILKERGGSPEEICRTLNLRYSDFFSPGFRLSYEQTRQLIISVLRHTGDPMLGILSGFCQSPLSWDTVGMGLLTSKTLGEAMDFALQYQAEAGALALFQQTRTARTICCRVTPLLPDPDLHDFLMEHSLACVLAVGRFLTEASFAPLRVEFSCRCRENKKLFSRHFGCPVHFGCRHNQMVFDRKWLNVSLRIHDPFVCESLRRDLVNTFRQKEEKQSLVDSLKKNIALTVGSGAYQSALASENHMSDRTMRRHLQNSATNYRSLVKEVRFERAKQLLLCPGYSLARISEILGYSDVRAFRRAFSGWAGIPPTAYRKRFCALRIGRNTMSDASHLQDKLGGDVS